MIEQWLKQIGWTGTVDEAVAKMKAALLRDTPAYDLGQNAPIIVLPPAPLVAVDAKGWLQGPDVLHAPIHPSWYYKQLTTKDAKPYAIVAHYSATKHGTALSMAKNRKQAYVRGVDRPASWHVSVEGDGTIVQMAPFTAGCWHAASATARAIPGLGSANHCSVGVELIGFGDAFPPAQVEAAKLLWRALVTAYPIERKHAMEQHSVIDPGRRKDPGPTWMNYHASEVLDFAFSV